MAWEGPQGAVLGKLASAVSTQHSYNGSRGPASPGSPALLPAPSCLSLPAGRKAQPGCSGAASELLAQSLLRAWGCLVPAGGA